MSSEDKTPIMRESEDKTPKYNTQDDATPKMQRDRRGSESPIIQKEDSKEDKTDEQINKATNIDEMNGVSIIPTELSTTASLLANMGCRSVENFEKLNKIQEGTYGVVYRAKDKHTGEIVALKKIKMDREKEGFPITSLREIRVLMNYKHPNVVDVKEIVVNKNLESVFIVMEFVEHDLKGLMENMKEDTRFLTSEVKCLMLQLLAGVAHLHENWILHRDLKSSNLLYNNKGVLKVADFGLARDYGSPLKPYTQTVVTLWYRAPELLLGAKTYTPAIDMWSVGCIFAELITKEPLLPGRSELDQLDKMFKLLGTPNETIWPGLSELPNAKKINFSHQPYNNLRQKFPFITEACYDLLNRMLTYDPVKRITAIQALEHPYFKESPRAKDPLMMPTWPLKLPTSGAKRKSSLDDEQIKERKILEEKNDAERYLHARDRSYGFKLRI